MKYDVFTFTNAGGAKNAKDTVSYRLTEHGGIFVLAEVCPNTEEDIVSSEKIADIFLEGYEEGLGENQINFLSSAFFLLDDCMTKQCLARDISLRSSCQALALEGSSLYWGLKGDSCLVIIQDSTITVLPVDCNQASYLGNEEEIAPLFVGQKDYVHPDMGFVLCSRNAFNYIFVDEMQIDYKKAASSKEWCQKMLLRIMQRVNGKQGPISMLVIRVGL